jgi:DNA-nicking Smr family endonuclease
LSEYLEACRRKQILQVRVVHGKGQGVLRRTVHALLEKNPAVLSFAPATEAFGGWGATFVNLRSL